VISVKILIGCPIYKRDWILNHWIKCLKSQSVKQDSIGFVFEVSSNDQATNAMLNAWKRYDSNVAHFEIFERDDLPHFEHENNGRQWTISKYENMVKLRNSLLSKARELAPDYYFSLDSDILLENPNTIELLIAHIKEGADAVSPLMFMTPIGDMYPSVMSWLNDDTGNATRLPRYPIGSYFQADVIMAAKMMSKNTYESIDYVLHFQGEDVGWSLQCKQAGLRLYSASYIFAPHIMSPAQYGHYLQHGDSRARDYSLDSVAVSA